jgi:hypothetical protein
MKVFHSIRGLCRHWLPTSALRHAANPVSTTTTEFSVGDWQLMADAAIDRWLASTRQLCALDGMPPSAQDLEPVALECALALTQLHRVAAARVHKLQAQRTQKFD